MSNITRRAALLTVAAGWLTARGTTAALSAAPGTSQLHRRLQRYFVGTFTNASGESIPADFGTRSTVSRGLYSFEFDASTGRAGDISLAAEISNPGNLIMHSNGRVLYACRGQNSRLEGQSPITAFAIEGAQLRELNTVPSGGCGPTVGVVDKSGGNLLTTNFASNSIVCFKLQSDGSLGLRSAYLGAAFKPPSAAVAGAALPATLATVVGAPGPLASAAQVAAGRTKPHAIVLSRDERFAIAAEIDGNRCMVLRFDASAGTLAPHSEAHAGAGAGPRHLQFEPSGRFLYTSDEGDSTITAWQWNEARGELRAAQQLSTLPAGFSGENHPADIQVHPGGRFVYVSNRATGTLAGYGINQRDGSLTRIGDTDMGSPSSWSFLFDPSGQWLLLTAQIGDYVAIYRVNQRSGALAPTGQRLAVTLPICIRNSG
jgi:6-phosphogluconolactonase